MIRNFRENKQSFVMICLALFLVMFIIGIIFIIWLLFFGGMQSLSNMCLLFVVPIFLIIVCAILAKKYLFTKGGKK
jgi:flagellar biosynthesis protein FliQ